MGAFNVVTATVVCRHCDTEVPVRVQFKYGNTWQYEYQVGDILKWGGNAIGKPGKRRVIVDGIAESCPKCSYDEEWNFYVLIEHDVIIAVEPATGRYDLPNAGEPYVVLED